MDITANGRDRYRTPQHMNFTADGRDRYRKLKHMNFTANKRDRYRTVHHMDITVGIRTIARVDIILKDTIPNGHNPERALT